MATKQLTAKVAAAARFNPKGPGAQYLWQKGDRGTHWGLRLYPDGRKTVVVRHWNSLGQRQQLATLAPLDSFPDFNAAKSAALVAMAEMSRNNRIAPARDPNEAGTIAGIVQWYIDSHIDAKRSPRYKRDCEYSLRKYIKPRIGNRMPAEFDGDLGPQLAEDFHQAVTVGNRVDAEPAPGLAKATETAPKRRRKGGGRVVANAAVRLLRAAFNEAIRVRKLPATYANPWATVRLNAEKSRTSVMTAEQAAALMDQIDQNPDARFRHFFRLQLHTGMRGGELARVRWEHVRTEGDNPAITLPAAKNGRPYVAPLGPDAVAELEAMRKARDPKSPWLFPGRAKRRDRKDSHMSVPAKEFRAAVKAAGLDGGISPHVIRATVLTLLAAKGATAEQLQKLSNHRSLSTLAKYVRLGEDVAQRLAVDLGGIYRDARITAKAKAAKKAEQGDNVIEFPKPAAQS
jgi:integrase